MQTHRIKHWPLSRSSSLPGKTLIFGAIGGVLVLLAFLFWSVSLPKGKVAVGVVVGNQTLSGMPLSSVPEIISSEIEASPNSVVKIIFEEKTWQTNTQNLGKTLNVAAMTNEAINVGRTGNWWQQIQERWKTRWFGYKVQPQWQFDTQKSQEWVASVAQDIDVIGREPSVSVRGSTITIDDGERGLALDQVQMLSELQSLANKSGDQTIAARVEVNIYPLSADGRIQTERRAEALKSIQISLISDPTEPSLTIPTNEVLAWLSWPSGFKTATMSASLEEKTQKWSREPIDAQLVLEPGAKKAHIFVPEKMGRTVQMESLVSEIQRQINQVENATEPVPQPIVITTPFQERAPEKTLAQMNSLGIRERIAVGTSEFKGSIPNRVFNVGYTADLVHGTIIYPGEEFSFNESVGEISGRTGFKSAYVIKDGRTQLGDGGGVCQVSTTLFRAALNGGLPITRWKAHSYRVGYYEQGTQPGFDATVYAPSVDFRFKNDTPHTLAVAASADLENQFLTIEFWGTSDGRQSEISDYRIWNQRSAPAPAFIEDSNLPAGRRQQIDWAAPGANTSFRYTVKSSSGETLHEREFVSVFRPWQAVYLVGTGN